MNVIHKDEIKGMGDYVIVDKVFNGETKDSEKEDKKEDESNEKVKVNINID